jgi:hypothetical protein
MCSFIAIASRDSSPSHVCWYGELSDTFRHQLDRARLSQRAGRVYRWQCLECHPLRWWVDRDWAVAISKGQVSYGDVVGVPRVRRRNTAFGMMNTKESFKSKDVECNLSWLCPFDTLLIGWLFAGAKSRNGMKSTYLEGLSPCPADRGLVWQWLKTPRYGPTLFNNFQAMVKHVRTLRPVLETRSQTIILLVVGRRYKCRASCQSGGTHVSSRLCTCRKDRLFSFKASGIRCLYHAVLHNNIYF